MGSPPKTHAYYMSGNIPPPPKNRRMLHERGRPPGIHLNIIFTCSVLSCKAALKNPNLPQLGPKEAEANPRNFTEEQMRARQAIHMP